jgi:hypothetical protein
VIATTMAKTPLALTVNWFVTALNDALLDNTLVVWNGSGVYPLLVKTTVVPVGIEMSA